MPRWTLASEPRAERSSVGRTPPGVGRDATSARSGPPRRDRPAAAVGLGRVRSPQSRRGRCSRMARRTACGRAAGAGRGGALVTVIEIALAYAARGWPVFPLEPGGKRPLGRLVPHGLKEATADATVVERWWRQEPQANIGLVTGQHFDVLDVDGPEALDAVSAAMPLAERPEEDPYLRGPQVATPRGWHAYIAPTGRKNTVNIAGIAGIDWRGQGGYVVAPGSVKTEGGSWDWICGPEDPEYGVDAPILPAPAWILELFERRTQGRRGAPVAPLRGGREGTSAYASAALEREIGRVAMAGEGARNHALNLAAFALGQLVGAGLLDTRTVVEHLHVAAQRAGLDDIEARATIRSGLAAGVAQPRTRSAA
ncbi:DNA primase [Acidimicrobiaceae bacterium USS-CC1]|uniref:DNA primase n=1 Tax=Acidiferrimicrobium australe TaxID=2664430 RepID=A0ABW9QQ32_9ACTN|nr:DNA primase [Acidiferrimicrobium australe]